MTKSMNSYKTKTTISIDAELLAVTDTIAVEMEVSRSQVVATALDQYIQRYQNRELLNQINDAYANEPDPEDAETMKFIYSRRRKLGDHREWK